MKRGKILLVQSKKILFDANIIINYLRRVEYSKSNLRYYIAMDYKIRITNEVRKEITYLFKNRKYKNQQKHFLGILGYIKIVGLNKRIHTRATYLQRIINQSSINYKDFLIASIAIEYKMPIATDDKHFREINKRVGFEIIDWYNRKIMFVNGMPP